MSGYGQPMPARTNTMAILALVFAFVFYPLGIVFGFIARSQIRQSGEEGSGLALAGIVIGFVMLGLTVLMVAIWVVLFGALFGLAGSVGPDGPSALGLVGLA